MLQELDMFNTLVLRLKKNVILLSNNSKISDITHKLWIKIHGYLIYLFYTFWFFYHRS